MLNYITDMPVDKFINREKELNFLQEKLVSENFEFIVIYGRRRVGKTRLIQQVLQSSQSQRTFYFLATEQDVSINLERFKQEAAEQLDDSRIMSLKNDWDAILQYLCEYNTVVVIDEFPYLIEYDKSIKSQFQRIIDKYIAQTSSTLILCGSSIAMMKSQVLASKSPLYGRRTGQMKIRPLGFRELHLFFPNYNFEELVMSYATLGGMPYYLHTFSRKLTFWENLKEQVLSEFSVLYQEVEFLIKEEFSTPATYMSILEQIAKGRTEVNEIRNQLSRSGDISSYINNLREVELIRREVPLGEDPIKSRRGKYYLEDNYIRFWFTYLLHNQSRIVQSLQEQIISTIQSDFDSFIGPVYEQIVMQWIEWLSQQGSTILPFRPRDAGRWWYKETEIDIILLDDENQAYVEVKWSDLGNKDVTRVFQALDQKSGTTKFKGRYHYIIICREFQGDQNILENNQLVFDKTDMIGDWIKSVK